MTDPAHPPPNPPRDGDVRKTVGRMPATRNVLERLEALNEFVRALTPPGASVDDDFVRKVVGRARPR